MRTIGEVEMVAGANWADVPPKYDNLTDNRTMEWAMIEEIGDVKKELQKLVDLTDALSNKFVGGLQQGTITEWEQIAEMLSNYADVMEQKMETIIERFD